jgi:deferrochelatase/peroxidase EfeB
MTADTGNGRAISRRRFLAAAGAIGASAALGAGGYAIATRVATHGDTRALVPALVPFYGEHQAGIATPPQDRLLFASFDVTTGDRRELQDLLRGWTAAAARMTAGQPVSDSAASAVTPLGDNGDADGLAQSRLTITFGFGPSLFQQDGRDRFGIAARRPAALIDMPAFPKDALDPARSQGDLGVQVCAEDSQVALQAMRNLTRAGVGAVTMKWSQLGFGRTSSASTPRQALRNLQGFKDGTNNVKGEDGAAMNEHVWVAQRDGPGWMRGGSYMVTRRIRMLIEAWDRSTLSDQEHTIGRVKASGAPLGGSAESDTPDLAARGANGSYVIPADAHIRLASPAMNGGHRILRRGYSFTDSTDPATGQPDSGLFLIAFQRDPRTQFVPIQQRLASHDALNKYIQHVGSAIFACPPGVSPGESIGDALFV